MPEAVSIEDLDDHQVELHAFQQHPAEDREEEEMQQSSHYSTSCLGGETEPGGGCERGGDA